MKNKKLLVVGLVGIGCIIIGLMMFPLFQNDINPPPQEEDSFPEEHIPPIEVFPLFEEQIPELRPIIPNPTVIDLSTSNSIELRWEEVQDARSYCIYRNVEGKSGFYLIKQGITDLRYLDHVPSRGVYTYKIKAYNGLYYSKFSNTQSVEVIEIQYVIHDLSEEEFLFEDQVPELRPIIPNPTYYNHIELRWEEVPDARSYCIYRHVEGVQSLVLVKEGITDLRYIDVVSDGGVYTYRIKAYNGLYYSRFSNPQSVEFLKIENWIFG